MVAVKECLIMLLRTLQVDFLINFLVITQKSIAYCHFD